jgi:transcriptional regulator with XRE-family HTH domain
MSPNGVIFRGMTPDSPLRRWRRKHGFTQGQLAKSCGVAMQTVARWERAEQEGGRSPTGQALVRLIQLTKIPAEGLIFPESYLREHPMYLEQWATGPQLRGRPRRQPPEEGHPE